MHAAGGGLLHRVLVWRHPGVSYPQVTLKDGRVVSSWSEEWLLECLERYLATPRLTEGERIGMARQALRAGGKGTKRFFDDENIEDVIGATGEAEFAKVFKLKVDETPRPGGDNGIDFVVDVGNKRLTIDVKTARNPLYLLVKVKDARRCADLLVLAKYHRDKSITFLGWQDKATIVKQPTRDFGYGIVSHYIPAHQLRRLSELREVLAGCVQVW